MTACPQDSELSEFIARALPPVTAARLEAHVADCADCRRLLFALASTSILEDDVAPPAVRFGRFETIDVIGRGAMGVVYRARDPELDRVVAIKLRRGQGRLEVEGEDRLRREAQALARLTHPNVVAVYEAGRQDDKTYFAMEYVEGSSLDAWLAKPRQPAEVIARMVEAGRGLAAAHAAGLVHRDFKPHNVFVSKEGIAKVGDFGLVRVEGEPAELPGPSTSRDLALTLSGAMLGTPAYMAPEQLRGAPATEACDQFSYCVTFFEALYGQRPFPGASIDELLAAMDRPLVLPASPRIPPAVSRVLVRGLASDPARRFASMAALLAVLDPHVRRRRRGAVVAGLALAAVPAGGIAIMAMRSAPTEVCRGAERNLAGIWDADRKDQIRRAFLATGLPYAEDTWRGVERSLDGAMTRWTTMHRSACEATRVHGEQSEAVLSLRMWCLDDRLRETKALTDTLGAADATVLNRAVDAADRLTAVDACADARALTEKQPPRDPAARLRIDGLQAELAKGRAASNLGDFETSVAILDRVTTAAQTEVYAPLEAEALLELGRTRFFLDGDAKQAEQILMKAVFAAERGRHDMVRARAWTVLVFLVGIAQARHAEGHELAEHAAAVIKRLVGAEALEGQLLGNLAQLATIEGKIVEAQQMLERSLAMLEGKLGADHVEVGRAVAQLSEVARRNGDLDRALALAERAHAIHERGYGPRHPETAKSLFSVGMALEDQGKFEPAAEKVTRTLAIIEAALGPDHIDLAVATDELGIIRRKQDRIDDAIKHHSRALALREKGLGPDHPETAISLDNLGLVLGMAKRHDEALAHHKRALAVTTKALGADHPETAASRGYLANLYLDTGRHREALVEFRAALELTEKAWGPDHFDLSFYLSGIGHALVGSGQPQAAIAPLERALKLRGDDGDPASTAEIKFGLARALWDAKQDRARARALAEEALEAYSKLSKRDVEDWLAAHRL
ncbi:MAG: tetratricopeptide repeat protein [Myxococcota bacterium]|nr:tetratricopeptide repeat protein [Myxococcota bacterium]